MGGGGHEDGHERASKRGKHGVVRVGAGESVEQRHGHGARCEGVRRSKRVAERVAEAEHDTEHAHKRGRHERVTEVVHGSVEPWRDK